jgi:hypothetical protein
MIRLLWRILHIDWHDAPALHPPNAYTGKQFPRFLKFASIARWRITPIAGGISSSVKRGASLEYETYRRDWDGYRFAVGMRR